MGRLNYTWRRLDCDAAGMVLAFGCIAVALVLGDKLIHIF